MEEASCEESQYVTCFYRNIMPSVVRERRLALPNKFVVEYGEQLSKTIRLELPVVGDIWCIGLRKSGCLLWLQDGFDKFMKHFSVGFGKFLLFKYKGNSGFHLHIFDLRAIEIDYGHDSSFKSSRQRLPTDVRNMKKENDESIPDVFVVHPTSKRKVSAESTPRNKQKGIPTRTGRPLNKKLRHFSKSQLEKEASRNQVQERAGARLEARMYKTDNPFCIVQISESNIGRYALHLPTQFCKEHANDLVEFIDLRDSDDRSWHVRCYKDQSRGNLGKGWSQFVKDKSLQEGDVCVFEILTKGTLKVSIFHAK